MTMDITAQDKFLDMMRIVSEKSDTDFFIFLGSIGKSESETFLLFDMMFSGKPDSKRNKNASVLMSTYGGDGDCAYRMSRMMCRIYSSWSLVVLGPCKSAGTLFSLGANEIAFGPFGELGPLDIQLKQRDDLFLAKSGLDVTEGIRSIIDTSFNSFEKYMVEIIKDTGGRISTKMAADLAVQLTRNIIDPMASQIDPLSMGETRRLMDIAREYGERLSDSSLNITRDKLNQLVEGYPSHSFVIDRKEAEKLFITVRDLCENEINVFQTGLENIFYNIIHPHPVSKDPFLFHGPLELYKQNESRIKKELKEKAQNGKLNVNVNPVNDISKGDIIDNVSNKSTESEA